MAGYGENSRAGRRQCAPSHPDSRDLGVICTIIQKMLKYQEDVQTCPP